jgi:tRNA pseudouridine13 synthase
VAIPAGRLADALTPPRAHGEPLGTGVLKAAPEDFLVEEELGFEPAGAGQHLLLKVRKRDANTAWVARGLARIARCPQVAVGYAGIKDRRAIAVQWFSVPRSPLTESQWLQVAEPDFAVLEAHAHNRKLPRGALAANRFAIRIRDLHVDVQALQERLHVVRSEGVPNFFGPQRFGHGGGNLQDLPEQARALAPQRRSYVLSAARSVVFNGVLARRVRTGTWNGLRPGDLANLDGRGSYFAVVSPDEELLQRLQRLEIHPTGPLWGLGPLPTSAAVRELEEAVAAELSGACALCADAGMRQERRSLRLTVRDLQADIGPDALDLRFRLARGAYATTVLREFCDLRDSPGSAEETGD